MTAEFNPPRILVSNALDSDILPVAQALGKIGFAVNEFDSRVMSWQYRVYMKPLQRLVTNFERDLDLFSRSIYSLQPYREKMLRAAVIHRQPHILFVVRGHGYSGMFLREMKERYGIQKLIGWWTKGSKWYELAEAEVDDYDLFFFMNKDFVHRLRQAGHSHCHYLPHAANTYHYYPLNREKSIPVLFLGSWTEWRQSFIEAILPFQPVVCGPKWKQNNLFNFPVLKCLNRGFFSPEQVNERYNQSKVVLNINAMEHFAGSDVAFNQRIYDVPASGGFLLTEKGKGLEELYKIGEEVDTFFCKEELKDKLTFYLRNEKIRERISRKGYEKVRQLWAWERRAKEISRYIHESMQGISIRPISTG